MKKNLLKSMAFMMMLCVSTMASAAIDWSGYDFVGDGTGSGAYANKYKVSAADELTVVNIQKPGFAEEAGIYCYFSAAISECSVKGAIQGAGIVLYLSSFTAQETEVTVKCADQTIVFYVYYADGTIGGDPTPELAEQIVFTEAIAKENLADGTTFDSQHLTLTITSTAAKQSIDASDAWFADLSFANLTEDVCTKYTYRLKTGGKSSSSNGLKLTVKEDGYLYVAVRTGSNSDDTRTVTLTQDGETLYSAPAKEDDAKQFEGSTTNIYPYIIVPVKAGEVTITYPVNGVNFYAFEWYKEKKAEPVVPGPKEAAPAPTYPANQVKAVYSATYNADCGFGEWSSGTQYTQDTYGKKYVTNQLGYFGLVDFGYNCETMEYLHMDVYSDADMSMRIVPIHGGEETGATKSITAGQWNSIDIALSDVKNGTDWTNTTQIKIDNAANQTFWLDNIYFYTTQAVAADTEAPTAVTATLESAGYFTANLKLQATDNSGVVIFDVFNGETLLTTKNAPSATETLVTIEGLKANTAYTLSVVAKDESGNAAEAVTVEVTTLAAPAPAPAPTAAAEDVYAIYSDAYAENHTPSEYNQYWWANPTMINVVLGEQDNAIMYISNGDANGCFGWAWGNTTADLTGYNKLHTDIYAQESGSIMLGITREGSDDITETPNITAGEWNAIDIDLTDQDLTKFFQIGFWNFSTLKCFFIDNVYFYKDNGIGSSLATPVVVETAQKMLINGQLVIIRDGVRYNALGQIIE